MFTHSYEREHQQHDVGNKEADGEYLRWRQSVLNQQFSPHESRSPYGYGDEGYKMI